MKRIIVMMLWLPLAAACTAATPVSTADLATRTYILQTMNGEPFAGTERTPEIYFDENMRVAGQVCNRFMGQGTLKDGVLTVPEMASTMMLCADPQLNEMERDFAVMLRQGAEIDLRGATLTLRGSGKEYVYTQKP